MVKSISALASALLPSALLTVDCCGDESLSLASIVDQIGVLMGKTPVIKITDSDPKWFCGDNSRLKNFSIHFTPFTEGIRRTLTSLTS